MNQGTTPQNDRRNNNDSRRQSRLSHVSHETKSTADSEAAKVETTKSPKLNYKLECYRGWSDQIKAELDNLEDELKNNVKDTTNS